MVCIQKGVAVKITRDWIADPGEKPVKVLVIIATEEGKDEELGELADLAIDLGMDTVIDLPE